MRASDSSRRNVIIAEDDADSRALLCRHLEQAGYGVTECEDGQAALEAVQANGGGIVIADWTMPRLDGVELCRQVRELSEAAVIGFVYFILLTAHSQKDQVVAGLEAGADDYLTKPYDRQELLARLRAGERIYQLQEALLQRQKEVARVNAEIIALNQRLAELAMTDELTGLLNRRAFLERICEHISQSQRTGQPLGCIMFDVDRFKRINDQRGHHAGDVVLAHVARVTRARLRPYDVVGRLGGEEFCIACPAATLHETAVLAERVRAAIECSPAIADRLVIPVTVSLGAAGLTNGLADCDSLLAAADAMLYKAKQHGRNQVWAWTPDGCGREFSAPLAAQR